MRRADRLFRIVERLRNRRATTAAKLAEALEVSERTIYRDIQDLLSSGVPIRGEAGVGYVLDRGFELPPLMFEEDEIEALVLGAQVAKAWGDPSLARAADSVLAKVEAVLPRRLKERLANASLFAPSFHLNERGKRGLDLLRRAIRTRHKVELDYEDRLRAASTRRVRPLGLFYWGNAWTLAAWCELRRGFRNFRLDRISNIRVTDQTFETDEGTTLADFMAHYEQEVEARPTSPR